MIIRTKSVHYICTTFSCTHSQPPSSTLQVHKNSYETCQDYKPDQSMSVVMLNLRKILYFASHHFTSHLGTRLGIIVLYDIPNFAKGASFSKKNLLLSFVFLSIKTDSKYFLFSR